MKSTLQHGLFQNAIPHTNAAIRTLTNSGLIGLSPRRQKPAPTSPPLETRVSAALLSCDLGNRRVTMG